MSDYLANHNSFHACRGIANKDESDSEEEVTAPLSDPAVIYSLGRFRHYLLGCKFDILTDHCALCKLNSSTPQSPRLKRWALLLSEFDYKITYTNGSLHKDVDCLSRAPIEEKDEYLERICAIAVPVNTEEGIAQSKDAESLALYEEARQNNELNIRNDVLYFNEKLYVPKGKRTEILEESHDSNLSVHDGVAGTLGRLSGFW